MIEVKYLDEWRVCMDNEGIQEALSSVETDSPFFNHLHFQYKYGMWITNGFARKSWAEYIAKRLGGYNG